MAEVDLAADRNRALSLTPVSRETVERLERFVTLLLAWQAHTNLIAASTLPQLWTRHIADSLQLIAAAPAARRWIDLGSGAGFPGLVIACALAEVPGARVHLVESTAKKAAFLREAANATGAPALVHACRIETFNDAAPAADAISARALAPLNRLLTLAAPLLKKGAYGVFPKGQDVGLELTEASRYWNIDAELRPSLTHPDGRIVVVRALKRL